MERIEQALNNYFNKPMKLDINIISSDIQTVAKEQQKTQEKRQDTAKEAIKNDSNIQKIIGLFDATLDITSIKSQ